MKRAPEKDLYSILGVTPDATADQIRDAYLARARVLHPDRFDRQRQPQDWKKANEMLAELNQAYSILGNAASRAKYDGLLARNQQREPTPPSPEPQREPGPQPRPIELGELTAGQVAFGSLPKNVQFRLLKRQQDAGEEQFQVKLSSVAWNYVLLGVLPCWYWYLFADTDATKWKGSTLCWYGVITLVVGILIGHNCVTITRWAKSRLKPYFYVTPIYFLKTEFDIVSFRPIWTLKDIAVTHNFKSGSYQNSDVILKFDAYNESLTLSSKEQVETLLNRIRTFDTRVRTAYANRDSGYFLNNDDFYHVPRSGVPTVVLLSNRMQAFVYVASVFVCAIGLVAAISTNDARSSQRWVQHPTPPKSTPEPPAQRAVTPSYRERPLPDSGSVRTPAKSTPEPTPRPVVTPSYPEQSLPDSGSVRTWTADERVAPFEIKASQGSHYLVKLVHAYTNAPALTVFVRSGTTVAVDVPLGTYEVRYASGETWYGYEYLFGPGTSYSKADATFTFKVEGNKVSGFTITLYKVPHGNLRTSAIKPTQF